MVNNKGRKNRGFTLVEIMIAVAIMGVLVTVGSQMYVQVQRFFFLSNARVALQRDARAAMIVITRRLRQAQSATLVIDQAASQPYYSRISFTDIDGHTVRFYQSAKTLYVVDTSTRALSTDLRYVAFALPKADDLGIVSVSFTLEKATYEGQTKALHMASEKVRIMN
jgi:uncharacterized protein (TIGR02599 family)